MSDNDNNEDENTVVPVRQLRPRIRREPRQISTRTETLPPVTRSIASTINPTLDDANIVKYIDHGPTNQIILEIITNGISKIIANVKAIDLGDTNDHVRQKVAEITEAFDTIKKTIDDGADNLSASRDPELLFNLTNSGDKLNKYNYNSAETQFSTDPGANKSKFQNVPVTNDFKTLDSDPITVLQDTDYIPMHNLTPEDPNYEDANEARANLIQNRLNNCYTLELLYMKKHEEVLKLFAFSANLFAKYSYAVKVILYLLQNLVYKPKLPGTERDITQITNNTFNTDGDGCPEVQIPKTLIKRIDLMVKDQKDMEQIVANLDNKLKTDQKFKDVEHIITNLPGDGAGGAGAGGPGFGDNDEEEDEEEEGRSEDRGRSNDESLNALRFATNEEINEASEDFDALLAKYLAGESDTDENTLNDFFSTKDDRDDRIKKGILSKIDHNFNKIYNSRDKGSYIDFLTVFRNDNRNRSVRSRIDTLIANLNKVQSIYNQLPTPSRGNNEGNEGTHENNLQRAASVYMNFMKNIKLLVAEPSGAPEIFTYYKTLDNPEREAVIVEIEKLVNDIENNAEPFTDPIIAGFAIKTYRNLLSEFKRIPGTHNDTNTTIDNLITRLNNKNTNLKIERDPLDRELHDNFSKIELNFKLYLRPGTNIKIENITKEFMLDNNKQLFYRLLDKFKNKYSGNVEIIKKIDEISAACKQAEENAKPRVNLGTRGPSRIKTQRL